MVYLYAKSKILLDRETTVAPKKVFETTATVAKQLDALNSARPATKVEIDKYKADKARASGTFFEAPAPSDPVVEKSEPAPSSNADNDPKTLPKGRNS